MNQTTLADERDARRWLLLKRALEVLVWLAAVALFAFAGRAVLAAPHDGAPRPAMEAHAARLQAN